MAEITLGRTTVPAPLYFKLVASRGLKITSLQEQSMLAWLADSQSMPNIISKSHMSNTNKVTLKHALLLLSDMLLSFLSTT